MIGGTIIPRGDIMTTKQLIIKEIDRIPKPLLQEVWHFILFMETKSIDKRAETAILSESSLRKDWLRKEEDEAWKSL